MALVTNGNVRNFGDVAAAVARTGCRSVMSAEGLLDDPALFEEGVLVDAAAVGLWRVGPGAGRPPARVEARGAPEERRRRGRAELRLRPGARL